MIHDITGLHHFHKRKRIYLKHELYPHPNKWKRLLDTIIYPVALIGPILAIPQVLKIWSEKDASSIALITWVLLIIPAFLWVIYGFSHKEKPIILSSSAWILIYLLVITSKIIYG